MKLTQAWVAMVLLLASASAKAQAPNIKFEKYTLPNGLTVILHRDSTVPLVAVSVLYHVGSKNEDTARTGFAHFFEHLLFETLDYFVLSSFAIIGTTPFFFVRWYLHLHC